MRTGWVVCPSPPLRAPCSGCHSKAFAFPTLTYPPLHWPGSSTLSLHLFPTQVTLTATLLIWAKAVLEGPCVAPLFSFACWNGFAAAIYSLPRSFPSPSSSGSAFYFFLRAPFWMKTVAGLHTDDFRPTSLSKTHFLSSSVLLLFVALYVLIS